MINDRLIVAIHLITESSDHYNLLRYLEGDDIVGDLIGQLEVEMGDELEYVSDYYFTTNLSETDCKLKRGFQAYLDNL